MKLSILLSCLLLSLNTFAFESVMSTGELVPEGEYKVNTELQFITNSEDDSSGANIVARIDKGLSEESNLRAVVGVGEVDLHLEGYYKWVPIPDYENQPAIGVLVGGTFARLNGVSRLTARVAPIISKKFEMNFGELTPYGSLPIGFGAIDGNNITPVQLVGGAELKPSGLQNISFMAELGVDINDAFTYFSVGASLSFDDFNNIVFE